MAAVRFDDIRREIALIAQALLGLVTAEAAHQQFQDAHRPLGIVGRQSQSVHDKAFAPLPQHAAHVAAALAKHDQWREAACDTVADPRAIAQVFHLDGDLADRIDRGVGDWRNGLKRAKRDHVLLGCHPRHAEKVRTRRAEDEVLARGREGRCHFVEIGYAGDRGARRR